MLSIGTATLSFFVHFFVDHLASHFHPKHLLSTNKQQKTHRDEAKALFMWRNAMVSFSHAAVTGVGALVAFYIHPELSVDLISAYSPFSICLVAYSTGYFAMDSMHMVWWAPERSTFELLIHHSAVITCFSTALVFKMYVGYAVVALLVEVNSIFLHMRRLLKCLKVQKHSLLSRTVDYANLGTFIVFRFLVLCWMTRWLVVNRDQISFRFYSLGAVCLAMIMFMNIVLFIRLVQSDVLSRGSAVEAASLVASTHVNSSTSSSSMALKSTTYSSCDSQSSSLCSGD